MNNDLSKLSLASLNEKQNKCDEAEKFIGESLNKAINEYNRLLAKTFVRPTKILGAKTLVENYTKTIDMLREYSGTLTDEYNRRAHP